MIKNLGQVAAIYIGDLAPINKTIIWVNPNIVPYSFNVWDGNAWVPIAERSWVANFVDGWLLSLQANTEATDGDYLLLNKDGVNYKMTVKDFVSSAVGNPLDFKGVIRVASDFPDPSTLRAGDMYVVLTGNPDVTVTDPHTGATFGDTEKIVWDAITNSWESLGKIEIQVDLGTVYTGTTVEITSSAGESAIISSATTSTAGILTALYYGYLVSLTNGSVIPGTASTNTAAHKHNYDDIVDRLISQQTTGTDTRNPMSQDAITKQLALKFDKDHVLQTTGSNKDYVMSQYITTIELEKRLLLSGGTMTGAIQFSGAFGITDLNGNGMLYRDTSGVVQVGNSSSGATINSTDSDIIHKVAGDSNAYRVWDEHNLPQPKFGYGFELLQEAGPNLAIDLNTVFNSTSGGVVRNYNSPTSWVNAPSGASYGLAFQFGVRRGSYGASAHTSLIPQLFFDIDGASATSQTGDMWFRVNGNDTWEGIEWKRVLTNIDLDDINAELQDIRDKYLPLTAGSGRPLSGRLYAVNGIALNSANNITLRSASDSDSLVVGTGTSMLYLGAASTVLRINPSTLSEGLSVPALYQWHANSGSNWANHEFGNLVSHGTGSFAGDVTVSGYLYVDDTSATEALIRFRLNDVDKGAVGYSTTLNGTYIYDYATKKYLYTSGGNVYIGDTSSSQQLATQTWANTQLAKYMPLSGGTFTGHVVMNNNYIYGVNEENGAILQFYQGRTVLGSVGASTTAATHIRSKTGHATIGTTTSVLYDIYDSGNFVAGTDYVVPSTLNSYLPLSAGSGKALTGALYAPNRIILSENANNTFIGNASGYPWINSYGNEMVIGGSTQMTVNYRTPTSAAIPTSWVWRAGTSSSLADFTIGDLSTTDISNSGNLSNDGTANIAGLITAQSGVQIGTTSNIGWYLGNGRVSAGSSGANGVNVGNLLISNAWVDSAKVPTNGVYSKGSVISEDSFVVGYDHNLTDGQWGYTFNYNNESRSGVGTLYSSGNIVVYSNMRPRKNAAGWEWSGITGKGIALQLNKTEGTVDLLYNNSTSSTIGSAVIPTTYTLATQDWVNDQLAGSGGSINFSTSGSGTGYLVTGASGNTITGRRLTVNDINNFANPRFDDNLYLNVAGSGTTGNWARGFYIANKEGDTDYVTFGAYGAGSTTRYAYVIAGGQAYNDAEILRVYPTNITFGGRPLAIWGDTTATSYDTYKLYRKDFAINGTNSKMITNAPYSSSFSIFAPTTAGTSGQILQSKGSGDAPSWVNQSSIYAGALYGEYPVSQGSPSASYIPNNRAKVFMAKSSMTTSGSWVAWLGMNPYSGSDINRVAAIGVTMDSSSPTAYIATALESGTTNNAGWTVAALATQTWVNSNERVYSIAQTDPDTVVLQYSKGGDIYEVSNITINNVASATTASKLGSSNVGSSTKPIYLNAGTPTVCGNSLAVSITGNAASATTASNSTKWNGYTISVSDTAPASGTSSTVITFVTE